MTNTAYITARKQAGGGFKLFYRGTGNEVFPGMTWPTASAARMHAEVENARAAVADACRSIGADARLEIDGFGTMTPGQLADELVYLADYQG